LAFFLIILSCTQNSNLSVPLEIPDHLPKFEILINNDEAFEGYIFLRKVVNQGAQLMINRDGKIVWYQLADTLLFRPFTPYEKSYIALYSDKKILEVTYDGDTLLKLTYGKDGFDKPLHHEIIKDHKNRIVALTKEIIPYDLSQFGGDKLDTFKTDGIIVLSKTGQKLWHWSFVEVLDTLKYLDIDISQIRNDWAHVNSLFVDEDGHYVISCRNLDQIWKINGNTGEIIWKYGVGVILDDKEKFYNQHAIHRNPDGDYMILDNGDPRFRGTSRAVGFNTFDDSIRNTLVIELPDSLFTFKQGSVYQFAKDRFLFCSTMTKTLIVTNRGGDILWLAKCDYPFYRAYYLDKNILN